MFSCKARHFSVESIVSDDLGGIWLEVTRRNQMDETFNCFFLNFIFIDFFPKDIECHLWLFSDMVPNCLHAIIRTYDKSTRIGTIQL